MSKKKPKKKKVGPKLVDLSKIINVTIEPGPQQPCRTCGVVHPPLLSEGYKAWVASLTPVEKLKILQGNKIDMNPNIDFVKLEKDLKGIPNPFGGEKIATGTGPIMGVVGDSVNHPSHYNGGKIECIEYLEDQFMDRPHEWNAVKYITRADKKGKEVEDLEKAIWYLRRKIARIKGNAPRPNAMPQERAT